MLPLCINCFLIASSCDQQTSRRVIDPIPHLATVVSTRFSHIKLFVVACLFTSQSFQITVIDFSGRYLQKNFKQFSTLLLYFECLRSIASRILKLELFPLCNSCPCERTGFCMSCFRLSHLHSEWKVHTH